MRCETLFVDVSDGVAIVTLKPPNKRNALWYGMTGRPFNGRGAAGIGFVNTAVPLEHLREATMSVAREIAQKDPWALKAAKRLSRRIPQGGHRRLPGRQIQAGPGKPRRPQAGIAAWTSIFPKR